MKILCIADHIDPLVYSSSVKERYRDIDMVLSAGDLPMEYLGFISSMLNKPVYFVFGNHNLKHLPSFKKTRHHQLFDSDIEYQVKNYFGSIHLSNRVLREGTILMAGLGGSMRYNDGGNQFTENQMYLRILGLVPRLLWNRIAYGRFLDILLTHAPPRGIHDKSDRCHIGFKAFLWFMTVFKPRYLLHGHIHLYDLNARRTSTFNETTIINVYNHYVLELESPI